MPPAAPPKKWYIFITRYLSNLLMPHPMHRLMRRHIEELVPLSGKTASVINGGPFSFFCLSLLSYRIGTDQDTNQEQLYYCAPQWEDILFVCNPVKGTGLL
jgi:hypothetical protein